MELEELTLSKIKGLGKVEILRPMGRRKCAPSFLGDSPAMLTKSSYPWKKRRFSISFKHILKIQGLLPASVLQETKPRITGVGDSIDIHLIYFSN